MSAKLEPVTHTRRTIATGGERVVTHHQDVVRLHFRDVTKYPGAKLRTLRRERGVGPVRAIIAASA